MATFLHGEVVEWKQKGKPPRVSYVTSDDATSVSHDNAGSGEVQLVARYILNTVPAAAAAAGKATKRADYIRLLELAAEGMLTVVPPGNVAQPFNPPAVL